MLVREMYDSLILSFLSSLKTCVESTKQRGGCRDGAPHENLLVVFFPPRGSLRLEELKLNGEPLQISGDKRERGSRDRTRTSGEPDANQEVRAAPLIDMWVVEPSP